MQWSSAPSPPDIWDESHGAGGGPITGGAAAEALQIRAAKTECSRRLLLPLMGVPIMLQSAVAQASSATIQLVSLPQMILRRSNLFCILLPMVAWL